ncbi:AraC family transcriptional regulator [Rhizobium sp. S95]|uniref:AraC family transcriptional regulator n=1 Tax=Ciceribacter sichuanensis TaxID=2949647 RepID=A0AAJ1F8Z5_9HYPH|nr:MULTISPECIES: helix-turn-helix domain-containing protein [unclassified Ciceribacter]MCM2394564.1 AraC family transcriptional regulator [Ciceribacter sp. S95]MCO5958729.1 AraC family transcriptional regulator [Ciceribacter sp. S101]
MLENALVYDAQGQPLLNGKLNASREWAEVNAFCNRVYMPLAARPLVKGADPNATLRTLSIGRIVLSRFCFGVPTKADEFDPSSGNIIVVNTMRGSVRHPLADGASIDTQPGDSYVVDCSRTDYWNVANGDDLQFNLTIPHSLMEETAQRWYGFVPEDDLWKKRLLFGRGQSAWLSLVEYATRSVDARNDRIASPLIEKRIEETLCLELLRGWAECSGLNLDTGARGAAPRYVREAERLMEERAHEGLSVIEIAAEVGISARSLSDGFRRFRGITPHDYLTARRLDGLRKALEEAPPGETVSSIGLARGYVNLNAMATSYRQRFGESPYQTLRNRPAKLPAS